MSEENNPEREKLDKLFGLSEKGVELQPPEPTEREWVEQQLEAVAGDKIVGTLDEIEIERFVSMTMIDLELEEIQQMLRNRLEEAQIRIAHKAAGNWNEYMRLAQQHSLYHSDEEAEEVYRVFFETEYQKSSFWRDIRAKYDVWGDTLAIRHGWTIVTTGKKYRV